MRLDLCKTPDSRSGVSAERRKHQEIEECGFLPKAATLVFQRSRFMNSLEIIHAERLKASIMQLFCAFVRCRLARCSFRG